MKLVFYSGGHCGDNEAIDYEVLRLVGKSDIKITLIPSAYEDSLSYFHDISESFKRISNAEVLLFPIDKPFNSQLLNIALDCDFLYLGGGNTYYFLKKLRETGLLRLFREKAKNDDFVLGGMSAGGILLTPHIRTAGIPEFDKDENEVKIKNFGAMNLTRFEFFPHFLNSKPYIQSLKDYSLYSKYPIFACPDASGIVIEEFDDEDSKLSFIGRTWGFIQGEKFRVV